MTPTTIAITRTRFVGVIPEGKENIRYSADFFARFYVIDLIGHQVIWTGWFSLARACIAGRSNLFIQSGSFQNGETLLLRVLLIDGRL